jgi:hypothetical protein
MPNANGTFEVTPGSEEAFHEIDEGPKLTHATGTQRFTGDLQADGAVDWLMCYLPDRSATFVGLQQVAAVRVLDEKSEKRSSHARMRRWSGAGLRILWTGA